MAEDELKTQLRRWGYATVTRFAANDDGPSMGDSVLVHVREMGAGPKQKAKDDRELVKRDGDARLRLMAKAAGVKGLTKLPAWSCDPIRSRNDADRPHDRHAVVDLGIPDDLRWIERAVFRLEERFPMRALILREEFCGTGTQRMKAARVASRYEGRLSVRQYRYELQLALEWMRGKLAA